MARQDRTKVGTSNAIHGLKIDLGALEAPCLHPGRLPTKKEVRRLNDKRKKKKQVEELGIEALSGNQE